MPHFTTTAYFTRGVEEREIEVEIAYTFDGEDFEVTDARDMTEGYELTCWEWDWCEDEVAKVCDEAYADWLKGQVDEDENEQVAA
ncbi:MAG: hypothetical protein ACK40C_09205 [Novosphingobium meiothermophilum]